MASQREVDILAEIVKVYKERQLRHLEYSTAVDSDDKDEDELNCLRAELELERAKHSLESHKVVKIEE